ncbi:trypsin-1 [Folsomia candida]|uniref:trypsin-1 n=1 Tax=Folsomia candida TaxID=158441 RepID=UPI000B9049C1|nr:trypsin-1 [Folsomia candida]
MNLLTQALFVAAVCFVVSNSAERDSKLGDLVTITLPSVGPDVERNFGQDYVNWKGPQSFNRLRTPGSNSSSDRVYNGVEATPYQFPWVVWIVVTFNNGDEYFCGGVIIDYNYILTAAQCIYPGNTIRRLDVVAGDHDLSRNEGWEQTRIGVNVTRPGNYNPNTNAYDVGLIALNNALIPSHAVGRVALAYPGYPGSSGILTVSGWGSTSEFGNVVPKLRKANMTGVSNSACSTAYSGSATIRSDMMCARGASGGSGGCAGDAGGPLMCHNEVDGYFLCGIVSFGMECSTSRYPEVYQRMSSFVTWINDAAGINVLTAGHMDPTTTTTTTTTTRRSTTTRRGGDGGGCSLSINFMALFISVIFLIRNRLTNV